VEGALSSLVVGERTVSRCYDGVLLAEYALFDPAEVMVSGDAARGVHEEGYFTTAARARERLSWAGLTPELVRETFRALRKRSMRALARSPSVLLAIDRLGPYEAFEGGVFRASTRTYQGAWLDLEALVTACPLQSAAQLLQAVHLTQVLDEVADDVPVRLLTAQAATSLRAGERTWRAIDLESASRLPQVLGAMRVPARKKAIDEAGEVREELLRNLRARSSGAKLAEPRIRSLATLVARTGKTPAPPPSTEALATPVEVPPLDPPPKDLPLDGEALANADPLALFEELRVHAQLLRGEEHLRAVAQYLSSMVSRSPSQPELGILASRAWLAAGEPGHARHFARQIVENVEALDAVRLLALEIIERTSTQESLPPPVVEAKPIVPMPILLASPHRQFAPSGASNPPVERMPFRKVSSVTFPAVRAPVTTPAGPEMTAAPEIAPAEVGVDAVSTFEILASVETTSRHEGSVVHVSPPRRVDPQIVESLGLPEGMSDDMLAPDARPSTPAQARIAMTRLSRMLGRDYRLWYGTTLMTSVVAIEAMQHHLTRRFDANAVAKSDVDKVEWELMRHGALLSEILARSLGGQWVEVPMEKPGHWAMMLHPNLRVWPIGRVYRYFQQGHREADLVAFYLDLEKQVRRSS
jgi:hypothetical protein